MGSVLTVLLALGLVGPAEAATELRAIGAVDEVRVPAGLAVRVTDDGTSALGQVVVTCDADAIAGVRTERKGKVLDVSWGGDGALPDGCQVALHPDDVGAIVVAGDTARATSIAFDLAHDRALTRITGDRLDLGVRGRGQLVVDRVDGIDVTVKTETLARFELKRTQVDRLTAVLVAGGTGIVAGLERGQVTVRAGRGASLILDGRLDAIDVHASGHAEIDAGPALVRDARIVATGSATVWAVVTGDAAVTAGGRATVGLPGDPANLVTRVRGRARVT